MTDPGFRALEQPAPEPPTNPNRPPLWKVMDIAKEQALEKDDQCHERFMYAAELRAIAEDLAKRESEWRANCTDMSAVLWLLEEADRAEARG